MGKSWFVLDFFHKTFRFDTFISHKTVLILPEQNFIICLWCIEKRRYYGESELSGTFE